MEKFDKSIKLILLRQIQEWCLSTTTHAIPNICRSQYRFLKILWVIFFILSASYCAYLISLSIQDYLKYPVTTTVQIINEPTVVFPTISICNLNPFITNNPNISAKYATILEEANIKFDQSPDLYQSATSRMLKNYTKFLPDDEKKIAAKQLSDMFVFCKFNSIPCNVGDLDWYYDFDFGNCYKFNGDTGNLNYVGKNGMDAGFRIELSVGYYNYSEPYVFNRGLRIVIHNASNERVFITDDGLDIEPGKATKIGIKRTIFQKLSLPYSDCIDDLTPSNPLKTDIMYLMFDRFNEAQYTQKFCQKLCYQMYVEQNANCSDPSLPQIKSGLDYCIKTEKIKLQEISFKTFYKNPNIFCGNNCPIECTRIEFNFEVSQSVYPTNWHFENLKKMFVYNKEFKHPEQIYVRTILQNYSTVQEARNDLLMLYVYYSDISYTYIYESPYWTIVSLLSNFGGQLGLFVGMSFLSFVEIFEIIIQLIMMVSKFYLLKSETKVDVEAIKT